MKQPKSSNHPGLHIFHTIFLVICGLAILGAALLTIYDALLKKPDPPKKKTE